MLDQLVITSIEDVFTVSSPVGRHLQIHNRSCYGISFCYNGQITYMQNGNCTVSDQDHMVLLPQGQDYELRGDATGLFPVINVLCNPGFSVTHPTAFPLRHPEQYLRKYEKLQDLFIIGKNHAKAMSILYDMIGSIIADSQGDNWIAAKAISYMEQHYTQPDLSNQQIADHLGVSEVYFRRLFRQAFDVTPKQYILTLRIRKAEQLLSEALLQINQISQRCGFSSVYHFSRAFHQIVGVSPSQYRESSRRIEI